MCSSSTVTDYAQVKQWVDAFLRPDGLHILCLVGNGATGKSYSVISMLDRRNADCLLNSRPTRRRKPTSS
jgi:hypothetical protein